LIEAYPGGEWYGEGPQGDTVAINELMLGDVIQYDWDGIGGWDHAAIIVNFVGADPYVATHSPDDVRHYLAFTSYNPNISQIRYIHIERSNGYPPVKAEIQGNPFSGESYDDAGTNYFTCAFSGTDNEVYLGTCQNSGNIVSGFRFNNIQIPPGALIKYAYPIFTVDGPYSDEVNVQIYGDESGNSVAFSPTSQPASRPTPSAFTPVVQWDITDPWNFTSTRERRTTPQLSPVIQAIVDRPDWASGNSLSLIIRNAGSHVRRVFAYERAVDDTAAPATKLVAAYDIASSSQTFNSFASQDGWILESSENSGQGGTTNSSATTFTLGDNAADKQYRSILHFDTQNLPDTAVIISVVLKIKQQSITGTNPFTTHGNLVADIKTPSFGTNANLAKSDFQDPAGSSGVATFESVPDPLTNWYTAVLNSAGFPYINLTGTTQFRLAFTLDDNDDPDADTILFFSGNDGTAANRPQLIIQYYEDQGLLAPSP
jgi:hypothetical protein